MPGDEPNGNIFYLYGFAAVAIFILLVACINYMNLATARATKRSREVGMRKVVGATRAQLIAQFMGESAVFTAIATVLGLAAAYLALAFTPMGNLMGKEHLLSGLREPVMIAGILLTGVSVTVLAGLYPAFYLSSISPKAALTKVRDSWRSGLSIRQILVLVQMAISIAVIACTLLMSQQMRFIASKPLGFDQENKVWLEIRGADVIENIETISNELLTRSDILDVLQTSNVPGFGNAINLIPVENNAGVMGPEQVDRIVVGENFIEALDIELVEGVSFSARLWSDTRRPVMVNQSMVNKMGWVQPLGKRVGNPESPFFVEGVVADFHYAPLHNEIGPLLIMPLVNNTENVSAAQRPLLISHLLINISSDNVPQTLSTIEETLRQF
ncbi:MAG: FtsX-like permease family protein, partial [Pseudohongiellaceae bacterium]